MMTHLRRWAIISLFAMLCHGLIASVQSADPSVGQQQQQQQQQQPVQNQGGQSTKYNQNQPPAADNNIPPQAAGYQAPHHHVDQPPIQGQPGNQQPPPVPVAQQQQQVHQPPPVQQQVHQPPPVQQQVHQPPPVQQQVHQQPPVQQQVHQPPPVQQQVHQQPPQQEHQMNNQPPPHVDPNGVPINHDPLLNHEPGNRVPRHDEPVENQEDDEPRNSFDHDDRAGSSHNFEEQKELSLQFILPGGQKQCLYYPASFDFNIQFDIVKGSKVDFYVNDHKGKTIVLAENSRKKTFEIPVSDEQKGTTYLACVDNRRDSWIQQQIEVTFALTADKRREEISKMISSLSSEERIDMLGAIRTKKELIHVLEVLSKNFDVTEEFQNQFRRLEAQDRAVMEDNFTRVNTWSAFQLIVMVSVGFLQVFMIRSLFDERSAFHKLWKR